ncbi:MAG: carbohydrate ABC transporter permease [Thaumarchaeota archaeon]|nr:carbohydrate ABC transporter permease [Nitrososphaerota archaeon]
MAYALLTITTIVTLFPVLWLVSFSFKSGIELLQHPAPFYWLPQDPILTNYEDAFGTFVGQKAIWESFSLASTSTLIAVLIGFPAAYAISRHGTSKVQLFLVPLILRVLPAIVIGIPLLVFYATLGLLDTFYGLVVVYAGTTVFYIIWLTKPFIDAVPRELEDAAMIDGVARWKLPHKVVLPTAIGGLLVAAFFVFLLNWTEFVFVLTLGRVEIRTIPIVWTILTALGVISGNHGQASAVTAVSLVPLLFGAYYLQKQLRRVPLFGFVGR